MARDDREARVAQADPPAGADDRHRQSARPRPGQRRGVTGAGGTRLRGGGHADAPGASGLVRLPPAAQPLPAATAHPHRVTAAELRGDRRHAGHGHRQHRSYPRTLPPATSSAAGRARCARPSGTPVTPTIGGEQRMSDDDELERELRRAERLLDPVPPHLLRGAVDMFEWRTIDAELAELVFDSVAAREAMLVRGADQPRLLTFQAGDLSIELEVTGTGAARGIAGRLIPAQPADSEIDRKSTRLNS